MGRAAGLKYSSWWVVSLTLPLPMACGATNFTIHAEWKRNLSRTPEPQGGTPFNNGLKILRCEKKTRASYED
jgi:hypothetical protein